MGYDFTRNQALISAKEMSTTSLISVERQRPNYYHKTRRGLSYVTILVSSDPESEKLVYHDSSSATSSWDSDVSVGDIFKSHSVNMVSTSHLEDDGEGTLNLKN